MGNKVDVDSLNTLIDMRLQQLEEVAKMSDKVTATVIRKMSIRELKHVKVLLKELSGTTKKRRCQNELH